jgi:hypothetical protein
LFYLGSQLSIVFNKDHFFLLAVSASFFIKIISSIAFFSYVKKNLFFTKPWAAHFFVTYIVFSFVASIFINNKKPKSV